MNASRSFLLLCVVICFLLLYLTSLERVEKTFIDKGKNNNQHNAYITYSPPDWEGLPLSIDNNLYKDPNSIISIKYTKKLVELLQKSQDDTFSDYNFWIPILSEYVPTIGVNGVIDCLSNIFYIFFK